MIRVLTLIFAFSFSSQVFATVSTENSSYIAVSKSLSLFVKHEPAAAGKSTIVILNGLTHTTENWNPFLKVFNRNGHGLVQIDLAGQGKTLAKHGAVYQAIRHEDQALYVYRIIQKLKLRTPVVVLGLSYGGGIATSFAKTYPQLISKLILLAPYTEPQPDQDKWIRDQIAFNRIAFPYNTATDDELYDYFLRQLVYSVYPSAEPELLRIPYKLEAVFRMCQGIRKLVSAEGSHVLPSNSVFLIGGEKDQVVTAATLDRFWKSLPNRVRAFRATIPNAEHDLIKLKPSEVATIVENILKN